jgi:competence protein ComEA
MKWILIFILLTVTLFGVVDINNASAKELTLLNGVGKVKAEAIVIYRKGHCFKKVDDIVKVKGIGKKTLEKNRKNMQVSSCKK